MTPIDRPVDALAVDGPFELAIHSPKSRYASGEPIDISASLTYRGPDPSIQIVHGMGGPIGFGIEEPVISDLRLVPGGGDLVCVTSTLAAGPPIAVAFQKSATWTSEDPQAQQYESFSRDPELRLVPGTWHVYAVADFFIGECGSDHVELRVELPIVVTWERASVQSPVPQASAGPGSSPGPEGDRAIDEAGMFWLRLASSKKAYAAGEPVDVTASYGYNGSEAHVDVSHFAPEIGFWVEQQDIENARVNWIRVYDSACTDVRLERSEARNVPLDDWNVMKFASSMAREEIIDRGGESTRWAWGPGRWRITAFLSSAIGPCSDRGEPLALAAAIDIEVGGQATGDIDLATADVPVGPDGLPTCRAVLRGGILVRSERSGLGFGDPSRVDIIDVSWPTGYRASVEDGWAVLRDPSGQIVAREGEVVLSGGLLGSDGSWFACNSTWGTGFRP